MKNKLKWFLAHPFVILGIAAFVSLLAFSTPASIDFLFDGALLTSAKAFIGVALLVSGVWLCRFARAAFDNGDANGSTQYVVPAVYIAVGLVVASALSPI